jgi:hypothetical protein
MGLNLTVPYAPNVPRTEAASLLPDDAGRVIDGGRTWSDTGDGELIVTTRGLVACDIVSEELAGVSWELFDASCQLFDLGSYASISLLVDGAGSLAFGIDHRLAANIWAIASQLHEADAINEIASVVTSPGLSALIDDLEPAAADGAQRELSSVEPRPVLERHQFQVGVSDSSVVEPQIVAQIVDRGVLDGGSDLDPAETDTVRSAGLWSDSNWTVAPTPAPPAVLIGGPRSSASASSRFESDRLHPGPARHGRLAEAERFAAYAAAVDHEREDEAPRNWLYWAGIAGLLVALVVGVVLLLTGEGSTGGTAAEPASATAEAGAGASRSLLGSEAVTGAGAGAGAATTVSPAGSLPTPGGLPAPNGASSPSSAAGAPAPAGLSSGCQPAYRPCLPELPGDALNCSDLGPSQRPVALADRGNDPYQLDEPNGDGIACDEARP